MEQYKKIAVIDADLISKRNHNFPNLACMKISGYYKEKGYDVVLKRDYDGLEAFDKVFISKVFTDTPFPDEIRVQAHGYTGCRSHTYARYRKHILHRNILCTAYSVK